MPPRSTAFDTMHLSLAPSKLPELKVNRDSHSEKLKSTTIGAERKFSLDHDHKKIQEKKEQT
jgi:hypothetical protein